MSGKPGDPFAELQARDQTALQYQPIAGNRKNRFDAFDGVEDATLTTGPAPDLWDRAVINARRDWRSSSLVGALYQDGSVAASQERRAYEALPDARPIVAGILPSGMPIIDPEGILENMAALAGSIGGQAASPENFIGAGFGKWLLTKAGVTGGTVAARTFAGVIDVASINAAIDASIQGIEIAKGERDGFSTTQLLTTTAVGALFGGATAKWTQTGQRWSADSDMTVGEAIAGNAAGDMRANRAIDATGGKLPQIVSEAVARFKAAVAARDGLQAGDVTAARAADQAVWEAAAAVREASAAASRDALAAAKATKPASPEPAAPPAALDVPPGLEPVPGAAAAEVRAGDMAEGPAPNVRNEPAPASVEGAARAVEPAAPAAAGAPELPPVAAAARVAPETPLPEGPLARTDGPPAREAVPGAASAPDAVSPPDGPQGSTKGAARGEPKRADAGVASADPVAIPELVRLHDLAAQLEEALGLPAVRKGRMSVRAPKGGKVLGQYDARTGVVRVAATDDFSTLAHEAGHHMETHLGAALQALMKAHETELRALDYIPNRPDVRVGRKEGLAEYLRLAMTNPAYAANAAPGFDAAFRAMLARDNPALLRTLDDMAVAFDAWIQQPSRAAVTSTIVSSRKPGWLDAAKKIFGKDWRGFAGTIRQALDSSYQFWVDDLHGLATGVRELAKMVSQRVGKAVELNIANDAYKLARMARGAGATATSWINFGIRGYRSTAIVSPSLRDAIIEAIGAGNSLMPWDDGLVQQFGAYLWSRRALGEWERFARGEIPNPPDKLTKGDHTVAVAEFEAKHPTFVTAADKIYQINRALWDLKRDAGLITADEHAAGLLIRDYVPGQRHFDEDERAGANSGGPNDGTGAVIKRFRGSTRDVINPLESMMADMHQTSGMIARNESIRALANLARMAGTGSGAIAEPIPVRDMQAQMIDPIEAATSAARAAGLGTADTILMRDLLTDMLGETKATVFRPAITNARGEPIVFYREGGEMKALRLADGKLGRDMVAAFNQMTRAETDAMIRWLSIPAAVLRTGITTTPSFLIANAVRDLAQSMILYGRPFQRVAGLGGGAIDELLQRDAVQLYNAMGGIMGGAGTANLRGLIVDRDLQKLRKRGWAAQRLTSFQGLIEATELTETATRVGLMKSFKDEAMKRGLSEWEATLEGAWRARDYIDFDRRGSGMAGLSRLIPFMNASLQGLDKVGRHMIVPLFKDQVTAEDGRDLAMAAKSWAYLGLATIASLSLTAYQASDWRYEEISDTTRATHWMIKWGDKWLAVPKPFEFAAIFNGADALYQAMVRNEPGMASRFLDDLWEVTAPPSLLEGNPLVATAFELATGKNLFNRSDLIPEQVQGLEPYMQWTSKTSELSKWLGKQFDEPPVIIDHLITRFLGGWGSDALALSDWATGAKGEPGWDDAAIIRRFIKDEARGSRSVTAFYDLAGRTTGKMAVAANSYKEAAPDPRAAADLLAKMDGATRVYTAAALWPGDEGGTELRRAHPIFRARDAVSQINKVRREIVLGTATTADGEVAIGSAERTAADDILADLAMVEARNALILVEAEGWKGKPLVDPSTYHRELKAVSPGAYQALADRFAGAKVRRFDKVAPAYGEIAGRLTRDGSDALVDDLTGETKSGGTELDGTKIGREDAPEVPGMGPEVPLP